MRHPSNTLDRPWRPPDLWLHRRGATVKPGSVAVPVRTIAPALLQRLRINDLVRQPKVAPVVGAPSPPTRPASQTTPPDGISRLGFNCTTLRRLPRSRPRAVVVARSED